MCYNGGGNPASQDSKPDGFRGQLSAPPPLTASSKRPCKQAFCLRGIMAAGCRITAFEAERLPRTVVRAASFDGLVKTPLQASVFPSWYNGRGMPHRGIRSRMPSADDCPRRLPRRPCAQTEAGPNPFPSPPRFFRFRKRPPHFCFITFVWKGRRFYAFPAGNRHSRTAPY